MVKPLTYGKRMWDMLRQAAREKEAAYRKGYGLYQQLADYYAPSGQYYPRITGAIRRAAPAAMRQAGLGGIDTSQISPMFQRQIRDVQQQNYQQAQQKKAQYAGAYVPIYPTGEAIGSMIGAGLAAELTFFRGASFS